MFQFGLYNLSNLVFKDQVESVYFSDYINGRVGILQHHEDMEFLISPCTLKVKASNVITEIFVGYGFAKVKDNYVKIVCVPIFYDIDEFKNYCKTLGKYGESCLSIR